MFNFKKLLFVALCAFNTPFTGLAKTHQAHHQSVNVQICDFDSQRDMQSIINIFNENSRWLSSDDSSSAYHHYLEACQQDPLRIIKVLRENNELVGYIIYATNGHIEQFAIAEKYRNKGYGKLLISAAIENLHAMNVCPIALNCFKDNTVALNFYKKMGFKEAFN